LRVVPVLNQKGGASKSTTVMNLAAIASQHSRVLVADIDPQKTASEWADLAERSGNSLPFEVVTEDNPDVLGQLRKAPYDMIFVDTPGNIDNMALLKAVMEHADFAVLPTEPASLALNPLMNTFKALVAPMGVDYRVVISRADSRAPGDVDDARAALEAAGLKVAKTHIRSYKDHERAPAYGAVVGRYERTRSTDKAEAEFRNLSLELVSVWANAQ
jgi:chromosome partitioning protein